MRRALLVFTILGLLAAIDAQATNVTSNITTNTEWTVAGSPYVIMNAIAVSSGVTLTVDPGVVVQFVTGDNHLDVHGTLMAVGTSASPISFTSASATPAAGNWSYVSFTAGASASQLSYVTFQYGGGYNWGSMIFVQGSSPSFDQATIASSSSIGLYMNTPGGAPTISNSAFSNNGSYGLNLIAANSVSLSNTAFTGNSSYAVGAEPGTHLLGLTNITATGNGVNAVGYRGGTISAAETWLHGMNWVLTGSVTVGTAVTLTVDAGAVVKLASGNHLDVHGTLMAAGTSASPISFTSAAATPAAGDWAYVAFTSGASASQLSYVTFQYGGYYWGATVFVQGSSPAFDHMTIASSSSIGLYMNTSGGAPPISNSTFSNNASYGLNLVAGNSVSLSTPAFTGPSSYAVGAEPGTHLLGLTNITATGNGVNAVGYRGGTISAAETWLHGMNWVLTGSVTVGTAVTLTVDAGTVVKLASGNHLDVHGTLMAAGTSASPISFTSAAATPASGDWAYVAFTSGASASQLSSVTFQYGGYSRGAP